MLSILGLLKIDLRTKQQQIHHGNYAEQPEFLHHTPCKATHYTSRWRAGNEIGKDETCGS